MRYLLALFLYLLGTGNLAMLTAAPRQELGGSFFKVVGWVFGLALLAGAWLVQPGAEGAAGPASGPWYALMMLSAGATLVHVFVAGGERPGLEAALRAAAVLTGLGGSTLLAAALLERSGTVALASLGLALVSSAAVLGATLSSMLCGHWYLIDRKLDFWILRRFTKLLGAAVLAKLASLALGVWLAQGADPAYVTDLATFGSLPNGMFLARLALGGLIPIAMVAMIWDCVRRESNQSATGLLYVLVCLVLGGEALAFVQATFAGVLL